MSRASAEAIASAARRMASLVFPSMRGCPPDPEIPAPDHTDCIHLSNSGLCAALDVKEGHRRTGTERRWVELRRRLGDARDRRCWSGQEGGQIGPAALDPGIA